MGTFLIPHTHTHADVHSDDLKDTPTVLHVRYQFGEYIQVTLPTAPGSELFTVIHVVSKLYIL